MTRRPRPKAIVWIGGVGWKGTSSTELRLIPEIARHLAVAWIAPPARAWRGWWRFGPPAVQWSGDVLCVQAPATFGITRWPVRTLTAWLLGLTAWRLHRRFEVMATVVASPIVRFPRGLRSPQILYMTDDWIAGAALMGFPVARVRRTLRYNASRAHAIAGVSPLLLELMRRHGARPVDGAVRVVQNGAPRPAEGGGRNGRRDAVAILIGQINERIDLDILSRVADSGVIVRIVGPFAGRESSFRRAFDALVAREGVDWLGPVEPDEIAALLGQAAVGLTPYTLTAFNAASSPLKTFDYLSAGLPVVSVDLPASRQLATEHVAVASSPAEFARLVSAAIARRDEEEGYVARRKLAEENGWATRARAFSDLVDTVQRSLRTEGL